MGKGNVSAFIQHHFRHFNAATLVDAAEAYRNLLHEEGLMFLAMAVVGGLGSIMGAVTGACLLTWLDLQLRNITGVPVLGAWLEDLSRQYLTTTGLSNIQFVVFGAILIGIMIFEPLGLYGFWIRAKKYWRTWPF